VPSPPPNDHEPKKEAPALMRGKEPRRETTERDDPMYEVRAYDHVILGDSAAEFPAFTRLTPAVNFGCALLSEETVFAVMIHDLITGGYIIGRRNRRNEVTWHQPSPGKANRSPNSMLNRREEPI